MEGLGGEAALVEEGGLDVADGDFAFGCMAAEFIGVAVKRAGVEAATGAFSRFNEGAPPGFAEEIRIAAAQHQNLSQREPLPEKVRRFNQTHRKPMIHKVSGDILLSKAHAIAHGVAPNDDFHSGLALALRTEWPALYKDFRHFHHQRHPDPGELWMWGGVGGVRIISLFTQEPAPRTGGHAGKASVENVNHALRALHKLAEKEKFTSIALPRLATGVGGLAWNEVEPLIAKHLGSLGIPIIIYETYVAGKAAAEPLQAAA